MIMPSAASQSREPATGYSAVAIPPRDATRRLAGITVSDTPVIRRALEYAREYSEATLFNHAVRSWLFAVRLGQLRGIALDPEVVAVSTLLHDIALTKHFWGGRRRFEVEGADVAREFARQEGFEARRAQLVWDTVALNSTPSLALYKEPEVALSTSGIALDFGGLAYDQIPAAEMQGILDAFPRLGLKRCFTHWVCRLVLTRPETTYDNFARDFGERFVPSYRVPSTVDFLMNAPFDDEDDRALAREAKPPCGS
jgi:hypothetical protein